MKKVLITGGLGYIGSHLAVSLIDQNYKVTIIDNISNSSLKTLKIINKITKKKFKFKKLDLVNFKKLNFFLKNNKFDIVFHLAGFKSVRESEIYPEDYIQNNIIGSINLLKLMIKYKIKNIIFSSSATVYGKQKTYIYTEKMKCSPINTYGITKKIVEDLIIKFNQRKKINYVILRYFNPAGSHDSGLLGDNPKKIPENLFPFITNIINGNFKNLKIFGKKYKTKDGTGARDYIHIDDLISAHIKSLKIIKKKESHIINVGSGKAFTVLEIIKAFEITKNCKIKYKFYPERKGDMGIYLTDNSKARKVMDWKPKKTLNEICTSIFNYSKRVNEN